MKKIIISFILAFILIISSVNGVRAEENNIVIKSIQIEEQSNNISSNVEEDNLNYNMNLKLYDIDDYVTYKIIVKNNSDKDYEIESIKDNLENDYIESSYKTNKNELKKGEEIELYLTLKYIKSISTAKETFSHDLIITFNYINGQSSTISDIVLGDDTNTVTAGNTKRNTSTIIKIICYIVIVVSIILLIVMAILRKRNLKKMGLLLILTLMIPTVFAEGDEGKCTIKLNVTFYSTDSATLKTGQEVNLTMMKLSGSPNDLEWRYAEWFGGDYLYSEFELHDWYIGNESIISIEKATKEQFENVKNYLTSENIVSTNDSKNPVYMWYEVTGEYWRKEFLYPDSYEFGYVITTKRGEDDDNGYNNYFEGGKIYWYSDADIVYMNEDASYTFFLLKSLKEMDLNNFDTSNVKNTSYMFGYTSDNVLEWDIEGLSNWDVSNVTDMNHMFSFTGEHLSEWDIEGLSNWDVSSVTNMSHMFYNTGQLTQNFLLDLSEWDISNVTDMSGMFRNVGTYSKTIDINLSNWNTSKVTDMSSMFERIGFFATTTDLNLSNWNTSKVTNMSRMFADTKTNCDLNIYSVPIEYTDMFYLTAFDTRIVLNYTAETESFVDDIINYYIGQNIVKGTLIE